MFQSYEKAFKRMLEDGDIILDATGMGWCLWPISNKGAYTEEFLGYICNRLREMNADLFKGE